MTAVIIITSCISFTAFGEEKQSSTIASSSYAEVATVEQSSETSEKDDESKTAVDSTENSSEINQISDVSNTETTSQLSKEEVQQQLDLQQKELEKNLAETEKKLAELEKSSKGTMEYIDTLDQKIGYINEQLTVLENQNISIQEDIDELQVTIEKNEETLKKLSEEVEKTKEEIKRLEDKFESIYEAYCYRLKVLYVSGDFNILTALLSCKDISSFLTRYEMIKSVSKSDTELLEEVNEKTEEIVTKQDGLNEQLEKYQNVKRTLDSQKASLDSKKRKIEKNTESIAKKKASLSIDRAESDSLLAKLTAENQQYTEFRNEDKELIEAVEKEVQDLIAGIKTPEEVTTAVAEEKDDKAQETLTEESDVYFKSDAVLNMLYPIPNHTSISAGYPNYSSGKYHGGIDFPCSTGSKVVAAQKGIVLAVKRLNYSYGYYVMIYHGTDSKGRSVVTLYAHNSSILVSVGQSVKKGETIAKSGSTGNSTGPHCHFEIRFNGSRVNPKNYLG